MPHSLPKTRAQYNMGKTLLPKSASACKNESDRNLRPEGKGHGAGATCRSGFRVGRLGRRLGAEQAAPPETVLQHAGEGRQAHAGQRAVGERQSRETHRQETGLYHQHVARPTRRAPSRSQSHLLILLVTGFPVVIFICLFFLLLISVFKQKLLLKKERKKSRILPSMVLRLEARGVEHERELSILLLTGKNVTRQKNP